MALDVADLVAKICAAMKPILKKSWSDVRDYAEVEGRKMAETLASIAEMKAAGRIDAEQAEALLEMQKHAMQAVLMAVEGIGLIGAQKAINAALGAIKAPINAAVGFALL